MVAGGGGGGRVSIEALTGFSGVNHPDGLNNTLLSRASSLKRLLVREQWMEPTFQGRRQSEEPLIALVQLLGQPTFTSSQRPPPTLLQKKTVRDH